MYTLNAGRVCVCVCESWFYYMYDVLRNISVIRITLSCLTFRHNYYVVTRSSDKSVICFYFDLKWKKEELYWSVVNIYRVPRGCKWLTSALELITSLGNGWPNVNKSIQCEMFLDNFGTVCSEEGCCWWELE